MNRGGITVEYKELVHAVQQRTGFSDAEAEESLDLLVESIAERLADQDRDDFACHLPPELQDIALGAHVASQQERDQDLIHEFMKKAGTEKARATQQIHSAWETLKSFITEREINHIKTQLPTQVAAVLY